MSLQQQSGSGVRILSLDSGGPGTYSQALILEEIEDALKKLEGANNDASGLIQNHFDLIGGVGFGGLLAIMLGRLGMTAMQAKNGLLEVVQAVFPPDTTDRVTREERSKRLWESVEVIVQQSGLAIDAKLYDKSREKPRCIVVVLAASSDNDQHAHALRTYEPSKSSSDPTIVEAACATISVPEFFAPVTVGPPMIRISFIGGPKDGMNPASNLLEQSKAFFGMRKDLPILLSLGCGRPAFKHRPGPSNPTEQYRHYESIGSGSFLDILSPVQTIREGINKRKTRKAQLSKAATGAAVLQPNAGWDAVIRMFNDCNIISKNIASHFKDSLRYLRLDVTNELTVLNLDDWTSLGIILGHTRTYLEKTELDSIILRLLERPTHAERQLKSVPKAPPRVSSTFVRREAAYSAMKTHLVDEPIAGQKILVITGMGGCGKTQLVSYFLRENESIYLHLIYVDASSEESIKSDFEVWIQSIKGHEEDDWQDALVHIRHALREEEWALVLDNADDIKVELTPFFPVCNRGTILITSRNRNRGALATATHIQLGVMVHNEAMDSLLLSAERLGPLLAEDEIDACNLLADLGHLPLAISLAGTYCRQLSSSAESPYTFGQYLEAFRSERSHLMDRHQVDSLDQYKRSVNTTIALSYSHLSELEKEYLELFAQFDGTDISLEIFSEAANVKFEDRKQWMKRPLEHEEILERLRSLFLRDQRWKTVGIQTAIANLNSSSLLSTTSVTGTIHIHVHPLVQSWACDRRSQMKSSQYTLMAAQVLTACDDEEKPQLGRAMLPHIQQFRTKGTLSDLHVNCRMAFAIKLQHRGYHDIAAEWCESAYKEVKETLGSGELATLDAAAYFASVRYDQGRYKEAEALQVMVWNKRKEGLGADNNATLFAASDLASTYGKLSRHRDALQLNLEVWEKRKEALGVGHPYTLTSAGRLATNYGALGRHQDALQLKMEVREELKKVLGADHPATLNSAGHLASTYRKLGRHRDALQLRLEVWERQKEILGVVHPHALSSASHLALTNEELGRHQDALQLRLEVWESLKKVLGADHPDTLISAGHLASTYRKLGRHQDTLRLKQEVWEKRKEILGMNHPETLTAANNLAITYGTLGRHQDALSLKLEVWEKWKEIWGPDHPKTLTAANNLVVTYWKLGSRQDALQLQLDVWNKRKEILGVDHPDTLRSGFNLACTYSEQGHQQQALQLFREILTLQMTLVGPQHPETRSMIKIASSYGLRQTAIPPPAPSHTRPRTDDVDAEI